MPSRNPIHLPARAQTPQYRFWGDRRPPEGRQPVRAQLDGATDGATATLRIYDPIDSWGGDWGVSAKEVAAALDEIPDVTDLQLHINSPGGEVFEAVAILNQLRQHPATVTATVDGLAASAASFLAAGADRTIMAANSQMMIHDAWGVVIGPAADMRDMADLLDKLSNNIAAIYADKSGGTVEAWRAVMLDEAWYDADEAVAAGLADESLDTQPAEAPEVAAKFDTKLFAHAGREDAPAPPMPPAVGDTADMQAYLARRHRMNAHKHGLQVV